MGHIARPHAFPQDYYCKLSSIHLNLIWDYLNNQKELMHQILDPSHPRPVVLDGFSHVISIDLAHYLSQY